MSLFEPVIRAFNEAGVEYVVVGGLATLLHGHFRTTADVDFAIRLDGANIVKVLDALRALGYRPRLPVDPRDFADAEVRREWVEQKGMKVLSFYHPTSAGAGVDVFAEAPGFGGLLARSELKSLGSVDVRVCSIDDLIAMKRAANRPIDRHDVQALEIIRQGS
ncbi:MAG TPA: hypothetical protein VK324_03455 [Tepidisphaeraceae bacterium]|nr:hypothetical protein [Tepidisphaeraceae bacterium]